MSAAPPSAQLVLDLGHRPALDRADFLVSECNAEAVGWIDRWPDWPAPGLVIWGPAASGKTHLGQVWRTRSGAAAIDVAEFDRLEPPEIIGDSVRLHIDGAERMAGQATRERVALHLYNMIAERGGHILLTARAPAARWPLELADLRSRLNALPAVAIAPPDDAVLAAVLVKLFADRQLVVGLDVIHFAVLRMERSFEAAERLVAAVDEAALASRRRVTPALVRTVLQGRGDGREPAAPKAAS